MPGLTGWISSANSPYASYLIDFQPIPEPSALTLLVIAAAAMVFGWWRRRTLQLLGRHAGGLVILTVGLASAALLGMGGKVRADAIAVDVYSDSIPKGSNFALMHYPGASEGDVSSTFHGQMPFPTRIQNG